MVPLKVGFIGAGGQALEQIRVIESSKLTTLRSVCDIDQRKAQQIASKFGISFYTHYQQMIEKEELDVVFICLPHHLHKEATIYSLSKQLHVIKEKPFALTFYDGKEMIEQSRLHGKSILTMMQRRGHYSFLLGKNLLSEMGSPFLFHIKYSFNGDPYDFGWRGKKKIAGGGAILDMGYHMLDVVIWYFGVPSQVYAQMSNIARPDTCYETEDSAVLILQYEKNLMGSVVLTRASQPKEEQFIIHGTQGTLKINREKTNLIDLNGNVRVQMNTHRDWDLSVTKQLDEFVKEIRNGQLRDSSAHLSHLKLVESAYQSERIGTPVKISLDDYKNSFNEVL